MGKPRKSGSNSANDTLLGGAHSSGVIKRKSAKSKIISCTKTALKVGAAVAGLGMLGYLTYSTYSQQAGRYGVGGVSSIDSIDGQFVNNNTFSLDRICTIFSQCIEKNLTVYRRECIDFPYDQNVDVHNGVANGSLNFYDLSNLKRITKDSGLWAGEMTKNKFELIQSVIKKFGKFESITYPVNLQNNKVVRRDEVFLPSKMFQSSSTCGDSQVKTR